MKGFKLYLSSLMNYAEDAAALLTVTSGSQWAQWFYKTGCSTFQTCPRSEPYTFFRERHEPCLFWHSAAAEQRQLTHSRWSWQEVSWFSINTSSMSSNSGAVYFLCVKTPWPRADPTTRCTAHVWAKAVTAIDQWQPWPLSHDLVALHLDSSGNDITQTQI